MNASALMAGVIAALPSIALWLIHTAVLERRIARLEAERREAKRLAADLALLIHGRSILTPCFVDFEPKAKP